ncbi:MAG: hypothetical protein ACRC7O_17200 [Fimbriiglobus sp.]
MTTATPVAPPRATLDDLLRTEGKAELIGGRIVVYKAKDLSTNYSAVRVAIHYPELPRRIRDGPPPTPVPL